MFIVCNDATGGSVSIVEKAGGRTRMGYEGSPDRFSVEQNNDLLFGQMNGTISNGLNRTATDAYGDGSGYNRLNGWSNATQLVMSGTGWTTLCPAPVSSFPSAAVDARNGWGCVIFDTYVDKLHATASQALTLTAGNCTVSNVRWLHNIYGTYGIGFDFEKHDSQSITVKVDADDCLHDCGNTGFGRKLDGDRIEQNGDDYEWNF